MGSVKQGYRIELAPTASQREAMGQHAGLSRFVENFCLDKIRAAFAQREAEATYGIPMEQRTRAPWTAIDLERLWRAEHHTVAPWFTALGLSSRIPKEACRLRAAGLANWQRSRSGNRKGPKVRFPRLRKRKHGSRFRYDAREAHPAGPGAVHLPKIGKVRTKEAMGWLVDRIAAGTARVLGTTVREHAGRWWATFQIELDRDDLNARRAVPADAPACGVDLGLKTFATIVDDTGVVEEVQSPRALRASLRRLRRANKTMRRRQTGSKNRARAAAAVAAIHLRIAHQRGDFLHQLTTRLARTKRAIAVESLNIAGMKRNRRLSRAVADAGFAEFLRQLAYKADWYSAKVWAADLWFPSSRTCSACGAVNAGLTLDDRTWECACGARHDRDRNAARNLLAAMHAA